jgi:hypothetical protein
MAKTIALFDRFDRGMIRDLPIDHLPAGGLHDCVDMFPGMKGGIAQRYSWTRHSASVSGSYCAALCYAPFATGSQIVAINSSGAVSQVAVASTTVTSRGTGQVPFQPPVFYREKVYIPSDNGTSTVKSYDGSSNTTAASGSPPAGMFCATYKDHLVLARDATNYSRVWFSNGADAGTWDTAVDGQWLDTTRVVVGLATLNQMLLVFSEEGIERIRGNIIPGVAGSDMVVEPAFNVGTSDSASIAVDGDYVVWANNNGVFMTDGIANPVDLTAECGVQTFWRDEMGGTWGTTVSLVGGIYQGHYIVASTVAGSFDQCLCFDIRKRRAWRFTNINPAMMAQAPTTADARSGDLFFGERDNPYVSRLGSMFFIEGYGFSRAGETIVDGNGTAPSPSFTTGFYRGQPGTKRWKKLYINYVMENTAGESSFTVRAYATPTLDAVFGNSPGALETLAAATTIARRPVSLSTLPPSDGIAVEIRSNGAAASTDFRVFLIEAEFNQREQSR